MWMWMWMLMLMSSACACFYHLKEVIVFLFNGVVLETYDKAISDCLRSALCLVVGRRCTFPVSLTSSKRPY